MFSRSTDPNVIVSVELGGAVSSPSPLRMSVTGSTAGGKLSAPLRLTRVGSGRYVLVLATRSLPIGDYEISMTCYLTRVSFFPKPHPPKCGIRFSGLGGVSTSGQARFCPSGALLEFAMVV